MVNLIELMQENTKHVFTAEYLSSILSNDGYMSDRGEAGGVSLLFEPCTLYKKKSMEPVPAFIVYKGVGPWAWTKNLTQFSLIAEGAPFIFTNGNWEHNAYVKSTCSNLGRKFKHVNRSTLTCVRNLKSDSPDRLVHDIFKVVEVTCL